MITYDYPWFLAKSAVVLLPQGGLA